MIRPCSDRDLDQILEVVNDGAAAYKGVIPADRWHEPYMSAAELRREMEDGVYFWGCKEEGRLVGVMGLQDQGEVMLIRHAYVRTKRKEIRMGGNSHRTWWGKSVLNKTPRQERGRDNRRSRCV
jgi:hypothetical protein